MGFGYSVLQSFSVVPETTINAALYLKIEVFELVGLRGGKRIDSWYLLPLDQGIPVLH